MKIGDACRLLQVTKVSLYKYQKEGKISGHELPNGYWNWDDELIYSYFNKSVSSHSLHWQWNSGDGVISPNY
ncbi:MAG: hypothetical protein JW891_10520 [Candidatus Lokiarchaeota archaeon]|nr:hypothetical protein [Candidatus Lokiarchaeota archaeon]